MVVKRALPPRIHARLKISQNSLHDSESSLGHANAELDRIRAIGQGLEQKQSASLLEIDLLRGQLAGQVGTQKLKESLENMIKEQKVASDERARLSQLDSCRLTNRICELEEQCNQLTVQAPAARAGSHDDYLEGIRASVGLPTVSSTAVSRRSGGNPAGSGLALIHI